MKRVLITGATGFIGRHCIAPLEARGFEVHSITEDRCNLLEDDVAPIVRDIAPTHLLHLAWYAVPGKYWTSRENLRWVRASLALYEAFVAAGGQRVVMTGSCAEYDWTGDGVCREATTPLVPATYYGLCKRALGELVVADAKVAGISAAWARYFFLYGPHEYPERLIASTIRSLIRGETAKCSPGTQERDFMHVADAAAATVALLDSDVRGAVNIASGTCITVRSLVERAAGLVGGGDLDFGALPPDPVPVLGADVTRLRDEVGFTPALDLDDGLRETIAWWRTQS